MTAMLAVILEKKSCTCCFVTKVMCTTFDADGPTSQFGGRVGGHFGAESPTYHFSQSWPLGLVAIFWKKVDEKWHLNTKVLCAKFG